MYPKVSIITVYYNRGYCIAGSVDSLLNQSFSDFELLLVDDGSSDDTIEKFQKFNDPRIRIVTHQNMGFTNTIRKAVDLCKGEYIAIHGSGDISLSRRIEKQVRFLDLNPEYLLVASKFERYDENTLAKIDESTYSGDLEYDDFLYNCRVMHGAAMFRKSAYEIVGGYERAFSNSQDWDLFLRFLRIGKGKVLEDILYKQFKRDDGVAANPKNFAKNSRISVLRILLSKNHSDRGKILERVDKFGIESVITNSNSHFQNTMTTNLIILARRGYYKKFLKFLSENDILISSNMRFKFYFWIGISKFFNILKFSEKKAQSFLIAFRTLKAKIFSIR